jgi:collagen type VII alpha
MATTFSTASNNEVIVVDGITYIYSGADNSWTRVAQPINGTASTFTITNTTSAISTTTGALQVRGGAGVRGNLWVGGTINAPTVNATTVNATNLQKAGQCVGFGYTGSLGYTGSSGYQGSQGTGGFAGSRGDLGYTGSIGSPGTPGNTGYTGSQGYAGSQGYTGSSGYFGSTGYTGSLGGLGYTGSRGIAGDSVRIVGSTSTATISAFNAVDPVPTIGDGVIVTFNGRLWTYTGATGGASVAGFIDVGPIVGPQGCKGYTGSLGYAGSVGGLGYTGSRGYDGSRGCTGFVGSQGFTGYTGSIGNPGTQGCKGFAGSIGYAGSLGYTGSQGYAGSIGYAGSKGDSGQILGGLVTATYTFTNVTYISTSAQSTSTVTGALVVTGGVGIGGNLYIGGSIVDVTSGLIIGGQTTGTTTTFVISNLTSATSTSTGALQVTGGAGIGMSAIVGGGVYTANKAPLLVDYTATSYAIQILGPQSNDSRVVLTNTNLVLGTGDFTIELWGLLNQVNSFNGAISFAASAQVALRIDSAWTWQGGSVPFTTVPRPNAGEWFHYALSRQGTTAYVHINGVQYGTWTNSTSYSLNGGWIGRYNNATGQEWVGLLSNIRVTKGTVAYAQSSTFTPARILTTNTNVVLLTGASPTITDLSTGGTTFGYNTLNANSTTSYIFSGTNVYGLTNYFSGGVQVASTTVSTSTQTGALIIRGGVGIGGDLYIGGQIIGAGGQAIGSNSTGTTSTFTVLNTTNSTSTVTGALVVRGGVGIGLDVNIGGSVTIGSTASFGAITNVASIVASNITVTGSLTAPNLTYSSGTFVSQIIITNTSSSTSTQTGALVVAGGVGIGENLNVGGSVVVGTTATAGSITGVSSISAQDVTVTGNLTAPNLTFSSGTFKTPVIVTNTASSTSTQSGAVIVTGGMGVGGTVYANSFVTQGGLGSISGVAYITTLNLTATNTVLISGSTASNSTTTGALVVTGGLGVGGDIYVGGKLIDTTSGLAYGVLTTGTTSTFLISNTTTSTGTTTGALVVTGGVGIAGDLYIGGQIIGAGGQAIGSNSTGTTSTFIILNTTSSTSTTTGALQVRGGAGIGGAVYIANTSYIAGAQIITTATIASFSAAVTGTTGTTSTFVITNTSSSTSTTTGALQVFGGAGIQGNVFIGGTVTGGGIRTSSTSTPPANPTVGDIWYNTTTDDIYRYTSDGVSSYWLDYTGPAVANASPGNSSSVQSLTPQNANTLANVDFTGIPSWAKRITLGFAGISVNNTTGMIVRLSSGGVFASSGYSATSDSMGTAVAPNTRTDAFPLGDTTLTAVETFYGTYTFVNIGNNTWIGTLSGGGSFPVVLTGGGYVTLSGALDGVRLTTIGGAGTFDAGIVNILYE